MGIGSALAIYLLVWTVSLFTVLPFGVRTPAEEGDEAETGHAESAPVRPHILKKMAWNSVVAAVICAVLFANYHFGWIGVDDLPSF